MAFSAAIADKPPPTWRQSRGGPVCEKMIIRTRRYAPVAQLDRASAF